MRNLSAGQKPGLATIVLLLLPLAIFLGGSVAAGQQPGPLSESVAFLRDQGSQQAALPSGNESGTNAPAESSQVTPAVDRQDEATKDEAAGPTVETSPGEEAPTKEVEEVPAAATPPQTTTTQAASPSTEAVTAPPTSVVPASRTVEQRGQEALQRINYPWRQLLPEWSISFHAERNGVFGYTLVNERRIEVYVRSDQSDELLAHVIAHELGHAVDVTLNSGEERQSWLATRGIKGAQWWPGNGASDFSTGAGDFAESFAYWQLRSDSFRSKLKAAPSGSELRLMQTLALQ